MTESIPLKRCTKCGQEKPANADYFRLARGKKSAKDGLRVPCKHCLSQVRQIKPIPQEKRCPRCGEDKPRTAEYFHRNKSCRDGLDVSCKQCKQRYEIERGKQYRSAHKQQIAAKNRRLAHTSKLRRRARKRALPNSFTTQDWQRALDYFGGCCAVCGRLAGESHTIAGDHWVALTDLRPDNPGTVPWNIVPLCHGRGGCNNRKQNFKAIDWLKRQYSEAEAAAILTRIHNYFEQVKS